MHYHGTPISPITVLLEVAGGCFCVSHFRPDDVVRVHQIGQSVMLDNGAFSVWREEEKAKLEGRAPRQITDWPAYYDWCDVWLDHPNTWAVIPDVINAGTQEQDALAREWPHGKRGAPVWHMDEPIIRLLRLCDEWPKVCIGSTAEFRAVLSPAWQRKMDEVFNEVSARHKRLPWLHMLRGLQLSGMHWPFASVDSTDIAQNHHLPHRTAAKMRARWDAMQCPATWVYRPQQMELIA